ncbi:MAG: polysaccharide deacetylase family protein, partial [Clostridia bacterium]|nr:polysaccharide deacetylase family protein [Clostridia bacterium]
MQVKMLFPCFKTKALTFSYDDGVCYDKRLVEIFSKFGLKGTFNVNSELFAAKEGEWRMTKEEALALYLPAGMEIAVHGAQHLDLTKFTREEMLREIAVDRENLEKEFGGVIRGMAYAYGAYNDEALDVLKECGIVYSRTTEVTETFALPTDWLRLAATCHHKNPRLMELADEFLNGAATNEPKLFYVWGHSYEFNDNDNW